jgi:predicted SAM-dependent methyltransferase
LRVRIASYLNGTVRRARTEATSRPAPLYLNLGSGPRGLDSPKWINIDAFPDRNVHFLADFARTLPFDDGTFDGSFCEHVLEHFSFEDGIRVMTEVLRVLKPGGTVRIIVPDAAWVIRTYLESPSDLVTHRGVLEATPMETVNSYFRQRYEHHFLHDFESMKKLLTSAGFNSVCRSTYEDEDATSDLALDDPKYALESLYVEARRP